MGILECPREAQLAILEWLPLCDLITLSMTSKDMRHLVEPLIYSNVTMSWTLKDRPPIMLLLRTILDRPELGSYVRHLDLDGEGFRITPRQPGNRSPAKLPNIVSLPAANLAQVAGYSNSSPEIINSWIHEAQSGSSDAVAGFLISMLPNLAWLSFSYDWTIEIKYIGLVFRSAVFRTVEDSFSPQRLSFESLRHVELPTSIEYDALDEAYFDPVNTLDALSLFYLPNIEYISVTIDNPIKFSWPSPTPPNPSLLSSLELGRIREIRLEPLLSALKNLRKLRYNWFYRDFVDRKVSDHIIRLDTMAVALATLSDTLIELEITAEAQPALSWGHLEPPKFILQGSLRQISQLHRLRRLQVPLVFVMGMAESSSGRIDFNLPPNVEDLALLGDLDYSDIKEWDDEMVISVVKSELENGALSVMGSLKKLMLPGCCCQTPSEYARELEALGAQFNIEVVDYSLD